MTSLLITDLDEALHQRLEASAALHQRPLEEEVREILRLALARQQKPAREYIAELARRLFGPERGRLCERLGAGQRFFSGDL